MSLCVSPTSKTYYFCGKDYKIFHNFKLPAVSNNIVELRHTEYVIETAHKRYSIFVLNIASMFKITNMKLMRTCHFLQN